MINAKDLQTILSTAADYDVAISVDDETAYAVNAVFISADQKLVILGVSDNVRNAANKAEDEEQ